jgi:ATP-dependent DNA helicase PIF1
MQNKWDSQAVDRTLRDMSKCEHLFGGLPTVLSGDFAQIPPVIRRGPRPMFVESSIRMWQNWSDLELRFLSPEYAP